MIERHHVCPVGLNGRDIPQNIIDLERDIHLMLHQILDINGTHYRGFVRNMRIDTNHHFITRPDHIERRADIQKEFFSGLHKLPRRLQQKHVQKMQEMQQYDYSMYQKFTGDKMDSPTPRGDDKQKFFEYHRASKEAQKEIAKEIIKTIQTKYYTQS